MQVLYHGEPAEVWLIGRTTPLPERVKQALAQNDIVWLDGCIRVCMNGLCAASPSSKAGAVATLDEDLAERNVFVLGFPGEILDMTNQRIVSANQFDQQYTVL